jgi:Xaa-Pro aminopeptidase
MPNRSKPHARLARIKLPEFGVPVEQPKLADSIYAKRYDELMKRIAASGADAVVIYADREHSANMAWLTGFDPRFEEALLIAIPSREPVILTGPENFGVATAAPLPMEVQLYQPMGLMGQDRSNTLALSDLLAQTGIKNNMKIGVCGWKYFSKQEHVNYQSWIEIPSYIVDTLREICGENGRLYNAGALFMAPENGLRATNTIDELARYEFAACHTSEAIKRVVHSTRPGMQEFEATQALQSIGIPLSCHPMLSSGKRAWHGLLSPTSKVIEKGDAITSAYGVQGALNCRAGWLAHDANDLPHPVRDYVDVLVAPYFEAIVEWLETIEIGIEGGTLDAIIRRRLGDPFFGIKLNPGHLIHLEEWMHTPISKGSQTRLRSGMAIQVDVIPGTGSPYFTTNIEDGIALLDENGRSQFAEKYPTAFERISLRREFMQDQLGISLKPDCLPFSNIAGWLPPFWLSPERAMTVR